jgi:signal transduction histidine kinase
MGEDYKRLITQTGLYQISLSITPARWINFKESSRLHFPKHEPLLLILEFMALICLWWLTLWKWRLLKPINLLTKLAKGLYHSPTTLPGDFQKSPAEVQEMALALVQMQEQVRELLHQRSLLLGLTSHDLRAILTRIKMRIELQTQNEQQKKLLHNIKEMTQLLDQLLSYSSEHQKIEQQAEVNISQLLLNLARKLETKKNQIDVSNIKPSISLKANKIMLKMALQNVIENAVKYGDKVVSLHAFSTKHETTVIVYDDGPGIPLMERNRVSDANYRGQNHQQPGIGLGLTFAKNVITDLRGKIEFKHNKPKGLKLVITFQT